MGFKYKAERMIRVIGCPYCSDSGLMVKAPKDFNTGGTLFQNVSFFTCSDCGQSVMSEETVKKIMDYLERPGHELEIDFDRL